ncbi:tetratricopeptide repeat protein, partial [Thermoleptolyngbya sp. C42_A2020_037]|uniref:tetratricopeptide repeat protein n=1 Tax=Thermoleptolyngbya sp. C42_A2020_037 TaxID=2747799 RepID=UPI001A038DFC
VNSSSSAAFQPLSFVSQAAGQGLSLHQTAILEQAIAGKRLKDIQIAGYADDTVQRVFCPQLWHLLSEVTGQKVGIRTLPLMLQALMAEPSEAVTARNAADLAETGLAETGLAETGREIPAPADAPTLAGSAKPIPVMQPSPQQQLVRHVIRHNLPAPTCSAFVGREAEITQLLALLSPQHGTQLISVDGIGGVGKTTLVLEAAYRCLQASQNASDQLDQSIPTFEAIVFTSAKRQFLAPFGLVERVGRSQRTLQDILQQIACTLGVDVAAQSLADQVALISSALAEQRSLLIVDNLDTLDETQAVLSFLYCELPPTVKAIVTTRQQSNFVPIRLAAMPESEALLLIELEAAEKKVTLSEAEAQQLVQQTGGIPVAIHYAIGQMVSSYSVAYVLDNLLRADSDVSRFCFEASVNLLRDRPAHQLLMALTFFPAPVHRNVLVHVALLDQKSHFGIHSSECFDDSECSKADAKNLDSPQDPRLIEQAFAQLCELSLIIQNGDRYTMLPLTQEYGIAELQQHPTFERKAREAWVRWCLEFVNTYGRQENWNWQMQNDVLQAEWQNIQSVIEWCMNQGRYEDLLKLWKCVDTHIHLQGDRPHCRRWWGLHLDWLDWLIQTARQRDPEVAVELIVSRGWLLTAMGGKEQLQEAEQLYAEAWQARLRYPVQLQLNLATNRAALQVRLGNLAQAQDCLDQAMQLAQADRLDPRERLTQQSRIDYYQGVVAFHGAAYPLAKRHFGRAAEQARQIDWQRVVQRSQHWLAEIALRQGDLTTAKDILNRGLAIAQTSPDLYQQACYQRSLAQVAQAGGDRQLAVDWGNQALQNFKNLNLAAEIEEVCTFLKNCSPEIE